MSVQIVVKGKALSSMTTSMLFDHFNRLYPDKVVSANLVREADNSRIIVDGHQAREATGLALLSRNSIEVTSEASEGAGCLFDDLR